jgi:hypothetical protein
MPSLQGKFIPDGQLSLDVAPDATGKSQSVTIAQNLTIEFDIVRNPLGQTQTATFRVFNLGHVIRDAIYKDLSTWTQFRGISFYAGYGNAAPLIFKGQVLTASSNREGQNMVTTINCFDGGGDMTNGFFSQTLPPGSTGTDVINQLGQSLPNIQGKPIVGTFPTANLRSEVLFGNTWGIIRDKTGGNCCFENGILKAMPLQQCIPPAGTIPVINSATGLIGTPRRTGFFVELDMLFEPRLELFTVFDLEGIDFPQYNGLHKVISFHHRGIISPAKAGECVTTATFYFGNNALQDLNGNPIAVPQ